MKKTFLFWAMAFGACLFMASSSIQASEELKKNLYNSNKEKIYTAPFHFSQELELDYETASDVFQKNMRIEISSPENLQIDIYSSDYIKVQVYNKRFQGILIKSLENALLHYSGHYLNSNALKKDVENDILIYIVAINFEKLEPLDRMLYMQNTVKSGCVNAVMSLAKILLNISKNELSNYSEIINTPDTAPLFWLPAVVTRWDESKVPDKNYKEIENYLCKLLCPEGKAKINGEIVTRNEYVKAVNNWKVEKNKQLGRDRYQLPLSFISKITE